MSTQKLLLPVVVTTFLLASCGGASAPEDEAKRLNDYSQMADSTAVSTEGFIGYEDGNANNAPPSIADNKALRNEPEFKSNLDSIGAVLVSNAASMNALDSTHLFIRTADVRCRVDEVANSTYTVEKTVNSLGGYVSNTQLASNQTWQYQTQVSDDSLRQITKYVVTNNVTIRVPAKNLDSLLKALVPLVDYMDYRNVTVNDITLEQIAIQLEQARLAKYNAMLQEKVVDQTSKPDKLMDAAAAMLAKQEQKDLAYLESLRLNDQVAFATVNLQLYQPETTSTVMIYNERPQPPYEIGIGERLADSLYAGWKGFSYILSGIVILWPLWLIGGLVFYFVRRQMKKAAKAA
jgi:hypothetical protein